MHLKNRQLPNLPLPWWQLLQMPQEPDLDSPGVSVHDFPDAVLHVADGGVYHAADGVVAVLDEHFRLRGDPVRKLALRDARRSKGGS